MDLVDKLQALCKERSLTLVGLERELGFGRGLIRRWRECSPSIDKITKVADYFGVSVGYLVGKDDNDVSKAQNSTERKLLLLARKAADIPDEQRENLLRHFEDTIDIYLKATGFNGEE